MFTYGEDFADALKDAQAKGYAEANPDADVLGLDAARKITILTALAADILPEVEDVYAEGITGIRKSDVAFANSVGHEIKLLGRCITGEGLPTVCVAPFLIPRTSPLATVSGVYNAVEVIAEPLGNVMFYGQGAGAGATASAVMGDLIPIIASGGINPIVPGFNRATESVRPNFDRMVSRFYIALPKGTELPDGLGEVMENGEELAVVTAEMSEADMQARLSAAGLSPLSLIRFI